jgi:WD40 repeat protein
VSEGYNQRHTLNHESAILAVAASRNERFCVTGGRCKIVKVWSFDNGELLFRLNGHVGFIETLVISRDSEHIVSGSGEGDKTIKIWRVQDGENVDTIHGGVGKVMCLAISKDNRYILAGGDDKKRNVRLRYFLGARD